MNVKCVVKVHKKDIKLDIPVPTQKQLGPKYEIDGYRCPKTGDTVFSMIKQEIFQKWYDVASPYWILRVKKVKKTKKEV